MRISLALLFALSSCAGTAAQPSADPPSSAPPPSSAAHAETAAPVAYDPAQPSLASLRDATLRPGAFQLVEQLAGNAAYERWGIAYGSEGLTISGELFIPVGEGPFPLAVTAHGHIDPAIYTRGRGLRREQAALATRGFAVLHPDYRGHGLSDGTANDGGPYDAGLAYSIDVANGVLALRDAKLPRIDTERAAILGHSMGGGVALNLAVTHPELFDAVALYAPVHADAWENFTRWRADGERGAATIARMGTREERPEAWDAISARTMLAELRAPIRVFHGTSDDDVPFAWSEQLVRDVEATGKPIGLIVYEGEEHEFGLRWSAFINSVAEFFEAELDTANTVAQEQRSAEPAGLYDASRITKKPFGVRIDPATSPVQPERFRGYHTGADFELAEGEDPHTFTVTALCDGTVLRAGRVSGYGGVVVQSCTLDGKAVTVLYGHLDPGGLRVDAGASIARGDALGRLGAAYSDETDNERGHLHLSVHQGEDVELRGYTQDATELDAWLDPVGHLGL